MSSGPLDLDGVRLVPEGPPSGAAPVLAHGTLTLRGAAGSDLFVDPLDGARAPGAERWVTALGGDFMLAAHVDVEFRSTFDAGALIVWADDDAWLKLCAELSPDGTARVVSVVTRGLSDDVNHWPVPGTGVHLRVARLGRAFALHASADGRTWDLARYLDLGVPQDVPVRAGLLAQSPTGGGAVARFTGVRLESRRLADVRDGS
ncbi:DUF1349 domain-containing protein [Antribacter gilvus]|uniref:DUF1349 domain-containing protein n=1 Tax=Antribacter gilvus TaxID=2304675 RepID=UPI0013E0AD06|nr:DUF1349 domain-containing protein [Antribacter gilvus]